MSTGEATGDGRAHARAALAGNPSDGYGGAVLAVSIERFAAEAEARTAAEFSAEPASGLVEATVRRFAREWDQRALRTAVSWRTTIPRGVGLGGSSAIVIATARALCNLLGVTVAPEQLAAFALAVETDELGIAAGLQDRIAQAYGGLTFMDFAARRFEPLDPATLPPLVIAWREEAATDSGPVHAGLRARFGRGEATVVEGMQALARAAREARAALERGDCDAFARCADASFDARQRMMRLDARHVALVRAARDRGASANYAGSGGAIVAICRDEKHRAAVLAALDDQFAAIAA